LISLYFLTFKESPCMNTLRNLFLLLLIIITGGCQSKSVDTLYQLSDVPFIPLPNEIENLKGSFVFDETISLHVMEDDRLARMVVRQVSNELSDVMRRDIPVTFGMGEKNTQKIFLKFDNAPDMSREGYRIKIYPSKIVIRARQREALYQGFQTLKQMLPIKLKIGEKPVIPCGEIADSAHYDYRGAMLDVSRHFFNPEEVKQFIDYLAMYKMNVLHLHLADDQGWRIEIKSWPKLTEIGGSTQVGGGEGGYYTQDQYKDIVKYAAERYITIIPEIDMPGHTNAALASYAKLNCDGKRRKLYTGTKVGFSSLCTTKEITYQFVEDVVRELAALTPGQYIHVGGDESDATKPKDYKNFIERVNQILIKYNKRMMGWDDIAVAKLNQVSVAQHWAKEDNALKAVDQHMKLVMSPAKKAYLDMKYDSTTQLGLNWAGYIEVDTAYQWNPEEYIEGVGRNNVWGVECPLWTETVTNMDELEQMVFPRLLGYAEIGWTAPEKRDWDSYKMRLGQQQSRFEALELNYYKSPKVPWESFSIQK